GPGAAGRGAPGSPAGDGGIDASAARVSAGTGTRGGASAGGAGNSHESSDSAAPAFSPNQSMSSGGGVPVAGASGFAGVRFENAASRRSKYSCSSIDGAAAGPFSGSGGGHPPGTFSPPSPFYPGFPRTFPRPP